MTNKRFTTDNGSNEDVCLVDNVTGNEYESNFEDIVELLNELHEENEFLKSNYKDLVQFVKSKGYTLKDFISFIGQFQSVGVNKEDWE